MMPYVSVGATQVRHRDHRSGLSEEERKRSREESQRRYEESLERQGIDPDEPGCGYKPGTTVKDWRSGEGFVAGDDGCLERSEEVREEMFPDEEDEEGKIDPDALPEVTPPDTGPFGLPPTLFWSGLAAGGGFVLVLLLRRR